MQVVQHGACLGLGIAGLGSNSAEIFEEIKGVLYTDGAISGEAAGLALGLLSCGSGTDKVEELLAYAHDTQHEKVGTDLAPFLGVTSMGEKLYLSGFPTGMGESSKTTIRCDCLVSQAGMDDCARERLVGRPMCVRPSPAMRSWSWAVVGALVQLVEALRGQSSFHVSPDGAPGVPDPGTVA